VPKETDMNRFHPIAAALGLVLAAPVIAADADLQMDAQIRDTQARGPQGPWINQWVPTATGMLDNRESADHRLQSIVVGYDRATLDRGGWRNALLVGDHYAAAEALLTVQVGSGGTTPGADAAGRATLIAGR
jgi:hypothetical protein